ncbi:unnamed protein product, partial [Ceratitis capitata]
SSLRLLAHCREYLQAINHCQLLNTLRDVTMSGAPPLRWPRTHIRPLSHSGGVHWRTWWGKPIVPAKLRQMQ